MTEPTPHPHSAPEPECPKAADRPVPGRVVCATVTETVLDLVALSRQVGDEAAGAVVTFEGVVRNHDGGRGVQGISYSCHPSAGEIIGQIAAEVAARPGVRAVGAVHRVGDLRVGDTALVVAVAAEHRGQGFGAASDLVDEIKLRLPVWKQQLFADGSSEWSNMG
ncbi:Molybdopterin synthase catalytic subunit [Actinomyces bovis]|uniref:Molybdopterin synthase catalytic subunit n=1 Tax=Actinomyces bovis TaxID=1658 RepID=A0ABY1VN49_9ACTO|nr:molybdenum cofactor biosynthesis protein MoaE [Actinomyces bovis]SPT53364.1 Molybdopterin synthase catalytic subunit [Actinomyces bovis]VEG52743.1 Molybdopterin synthase catalytic subunit [Actinomyces israelii]